MPRSKLPAAVPLEHDEQVGLVNWFRDRFPGVMIFAIPNGEKRALSVAKRLKKEGVVAGVPDLYVPAWKLWIEMKRQNGRKPPSHQVDIHDYLAGIGDFVIVGYGATDASRKIMDFLSQRGL